MDRATPEETSLPTAKPTPRLGWAYFLSGCFVSGLLGVGAWLTVSEPSLASARLPSGERISLVAVTHGAVEHSPLEPRWEGWLRWMRQPAPLPKSRWLLPTPRAEYAFWLRGPERGEPPWKWRPRTEDPHGCRFLSLGIHEVWPSGQDGRLLWHQPPCYPRRDPTFQLVLDYVDGVTAGPERYPIQYRPSPPLATLRCTVPVHGSATHPHWKPEPYPVRRREGALDVELLALEPSTDPFWQPNGRRARFRYHGADAALWMPASVELRDATGNRFPTGPLPTGKGTLLELPGLCSRENAWELEVEFLRRDLTRAQPDHRILLSRRELACIQSDDASPKTIVVRRSGGLTLRIGPLRHIGAGPSLHVEVEPRQEQRTWQATLREVRRAKGSGQPRYSPLGGRERLHDDSRSVHDGDLGGLQLDRDPTPEADGLELSLYQRHAFTFRVKP